MVHLAGLEASTPFMHIPCHFSEKNQPLCTGSGTASEDVFDDVLKVVAECSSSAQFHERWSRLKRECNGPPRQTFRMFRAGILPFKTLSKNRDGGEFRCALHTGMTFSEAASCFATVAALVIDEELQWSEGVNGLCLVISPEGHCVKVWSGSV